MIERRPARKGFDLDLRDGVEIEDRVLAMLVGSTRVEVKYQPDAQLALFIEYEYRGKPSGLATTEAEWWCIAYAQGRQMIFIRTDVLRAIVDNYGRPATGGDDGASRGWTVRIDELARPYP